MEGLSCGIVIYDEIKEIQNLLPKLKTELSLYKVEWIFVLNHEQPEIRKWIAQWLKEQAPEAICIENPSNNLGFARQLILQYATNEYVYLTDPDIDVIQNNLKKLIQLVQAEILNASNSHIIGYGGTVTHKSENNFIQATYDFMSKLSQLVPFSFQIQNHPFLVSVDHLPACHILVNRKAALEIGGFSSALSKCGEDLDFTHRAYNANYRFFFLPAAQVIHWQNMGLLKWLLKIFHWGRIQIPVQKMNASQGLRLYRLLPVILFLLWVGLSIYSSLFFIASLLFLTLTAFINFGFVGFMITFIFYSIGEFVEIIWPLFEYRNAEELMQLNRNLENQYSKTNLNNDT